jgi:hypothetical protein
MARSDLVVALAKAGNAGDKRGARIATEAIIAEERAKQHKVLAEKLSKTIHINGNGAHTMSASLDASSRGRDQIMEIAPRRRLEDLILRRQPGRGRSVDRRATARRSAPRSGHGAATSHLAVRASWDGQDNPCRGHRGSGVGAAFRGAVRSMIGSYLGETAARLKRVFDYERTTPCVLFFDEFDAIGKERGDVHETGEIKRVVSSLLMQVDELPSGLTLTHVSRGGPLDDGVGIGGADEWCGVVVGLPQEAIDGGLAHGNL